MNSQQEQRLSKFLSLVLRHQPEQIGISLDDQGWTSVDALIAAMNQYGQKIDHDLLDEIVENNDKQRFSFSDDGEMIRANQGHSVAVELGYAPQTPPDTLYHGTVERFLAAIAATGLSKGQRHHVHLSESLTTATKVGQRRGQPIILTINAKAMSADGYVFYCSANGVWLTDAVPSNYIRFPS